VTGPRKVDTSPDGARQLVLHVVTDVMGSRFDGRRCSEPLTLFGMDSIAATDIAAHLSSALGRDLSPTIAFDHPTIADLTAYVSMLTTAGDQSERAPDRSVSTFGPSTATTKSA